MSDSFSLNNLRDIVEPSAVSGWLPPPTVYLFGALVLVWLAAAIVLFIIHHRKNLYRRVGLRELASIENRVGNINERPTALRDLNMLLKRVALVAWPRDQVASLSGDAWLAFLDNTSHGSPFTGGASRLLKEIPLAADEYLKSISPEDITLLIKAVDDWIRTHRVNISVSSQERPDAHIQRQRAG